MFLSQWLEEYENCMDGEQAAVGIEKLCDLLSSKKIIIYGAGVTGKQIAKLFSEWGIRLYGLVDKNYIRIDPVVGIEVNAPKWLNELEDCENYVVISAANTAQISRYIKDDYKKLEINNMLLVDGYQFHRVLQSLLCVKRLGEENFLDVFDCIACSRYNFDCKVFSKYAETLCEHDDIKGEKKSELFDMCGYILGRVCTLNCEHCCEAIPYVPKEQRLFVPAENVIADIKKIAKASRLLVRVEFVGGEPFLHPGLVEILEEVMKIRNIASFQIFTNGTVIPSDKLCQIMKNPKIMLSLSSYWMNLGDKHREKVESTVKKLDSYNIRYVFGDNKSWFDFNSFAPNPKANKEDMFKNCFLRMCHRLCDGVLYGCPHVYSGVTTGQIQQFEDECINIREIRDEDLPKALDRFESLNYYKTCDFCALPNDAQEVSAGIQFVEE